MLKIINIFKKRTYKKYRLYVYNPSFTKCKFTRLFNSKKELLEYVLNNEFSNIQLFSFREEEKVGDSDG